MASNKEVKQQIKFEEQEPTFYARMPNMADDDLDPHEYRLYGHYRRVAGEKGICWESAATTARKCHMGRTSVFSARAKLVEMGYITINASQGETTEIIINNVWKINNSRFTRSRGEHLPVHVANTPRSRGEHKEVTIEEQTIEETTSPNGAVTPLPAKKENRIWDIASLWATHKGVGEDMTRRYVKKAGGVIHTFCQHYPDCDKTTFAAFVAWLESTRDPKNMVGTADRIIEYYAEWQRVSAAKPKAPTSAWDFYK